MITYKQIFSVLRQGATISPAPNSDLANKLVILECAGIVENGVNLETGVLFQYVLSPKQIKPSAPVLVVDIPAKTAPKNDLERVRAMLTQRGLSCGSYAVLAETESRYQIEISTDPTRSMKHWIDKTRCEKVAIAEKKAA